MDLMETVWDRVSDGAPFPGQGQGPKLFEVGEEGHNGDVEESAIEPASDNQAGGSGTQPTGSTYQVFTTCHSCDLRDAFLALTGALIVTMY